MKKALALFLFFSYSLLSGSGPLKAAPQPKKAFVNEINLWKSNSGLQKIAKIQNPLRLKPGDGAIGINVQYPEKTLVTHQTIGFDWIRAGTALENGFMIDRGIMAFEWAFARMREDGAFGESKTIEISHFLGLYARAILLLRQAHQKSKAERLTRLIPRLEISLKSPRSLLGERRWNVEESKNWVTSQRVQAAAAAHWIGRLLVNPALKKTSELWLDSAIKRQDASGMFPCGFPANSKAARAAQLSVLESLEGLALQDPYYATKLKNPIQRGFQWLNRTMPKQDALSASQLATIALYAAWTRDPDSKKIVETRLKKKRF